MFYVVPLLTNFDYILILCISVFCIITTVSFARSRYQSQKALAAEENLVRNNYKVSNFGVPGEIKAIKTYDRSGAFVNCYNHLTSCMESPDVIQMTSNQKDNLQKIEGISPKLEKSFNDFGLYTFKQLTLLKEDKNAVSKIASLLPNQLNLEDICNQARLICSREELSA